MIDSETQTSQTQVGHQLQDAIRGNTTYERVAVKLQQFGVDAWTILQVIQNLEKRAMERSKKAI